MSAVSSQTDKTLLVSAAGNSSPKSHCDLAGLLILRIELPSAFKRHSRRFGASVPANLVAMPLAQLEAVAVGNPQTLGHHCQGQSRRQCLDLFHPKAVGSFQLGFKTVARQMGIATRLDRKS